METSFDRREDGVLGFSLVDDSVVSVGKRGVIMGSDEVISSVLECGMRLNGEVAGSGFVKDGKFGANVVESGVDSNVSEVGKMHAINLVVDLNQWSTKESDCNVVELTEKEGGYEFADLDGGDRFSTLNSFNPAKTVDFMQDLAKDPLGITRFGVSAIRGQLSAFNRWKGYHQLQVNQVLDNKSGVTKSALRLKGKTNARGKPRKHNHDGGLSPNKKVKSLSDLISNGDESVSDVEYKPNKRGRKRKAIESNMSGKKSQSKSQTQTAVDFLSQIYMAARNPIQRQHNLDSLVKFSADLKDYRLRKDKNNEEIVNQPEAVETDGFTGTKDSNLTDVTGVTESESSTKLNKENSPTSLTFKFKNLDSVPSVKKLHEIYSRFGSLLESETRVLKKIKCVKLVFERVCDAEAAFSSSGKYSIFGPALVKYQLNYFPRLRKTATVGKKKVKLEKKLQSKK